MASNYSIKSRLQNGETLYGLFLCSFSPVLAEITGHAGYDFVVVDMEHGHGDISDALPCLQALSATRTPAILRLPDSSPTWAKKALDLGPQGVMFPMIDTPELAQKAVSYCRYPPLGLRGAAHPVVRASKYGLDTDYLAKCENDLFIMCQIESKEGMDCIQIGPLDLSASMGFLSDPVNQNVKATMSTAETTVLGLNSNNNGPDMAGFAMPNDGLHDLRRRGYHLVSGGVDIGLFRDAVVEDVKKFKTGINALEE